MLAVAVVMKVMVKFVSQMWPRSCRMLHVQFAFEYVLGHEAAGPKVLTGAKQPPANLQDPWICLMITHATTVPRA